MGQHHPSAAHAYTDTVSDSIPNCLTLSESFPGGLASADVRVPTAVGIAERNTVAQCESVADINSLANDIPLTVEYRSRQAQPLKEIFELSDARRVP